MVNKETNYYRKLNIQPSASKEEIKRAYRRAVKKAHPDVNKQDGATELFLEIQEAFSVLSIPEQRQAYDQGRDDVDPTSLPIEIASQFSREGILHLDEPQIIYAIINIKVSEEIKNIEELPLNISIVLDTSTSMDGARLEILKAATRDIFRDLKDEDMISVVSFNDRAKVVLPSQNVSNPQSLDSSISPLYATGGTEIFQGLEVGLEEIMKNIRGQYVNHILLITDGHTYGDEKKCQELANHAARRGVVISALGIGNEWNDEFIDQITSQTGGQSLYIKELNQVKPFFRNNVQQLQKAYAKQLILELQTAPNVELLSTFRLLPDANPLPAEKTISLGVLNQDQPHRILFEFLVDPLPSKVERVLLADGIFTLKRKTGDLDIPLVLERKTISPDEETSPPPEIIFNAISHLTLYRLQEKAQQDLAKNKPDAAYQRMINLASHLMSREEQTLAKIAMKEADHIKSHHNFSPEGKKQIKYGTRRLMLPGEIRENQDHDQL